MKLEARKFVPTEELERVQYYVPTTSEKVRNQRLRMLKDLAAEVLERRKAAANNTGLHDACNALVQHLILEKYKASRQGPHRLHRSRPGIHAVPGVAETALPGLA